MSENLSVVLCVDVIEYPSVGLTVRKRDNKLMISFICAGRRNGEGRDTRMKNWGYGLYTSYRSGQDLKFRVECSQG